MWLGIDDRRDLPVDVIARNFQAGKDMLRLVSGWEALIIDNDLGEGLGEEGYNILVYAEELGVIPPLVQIVTDNPVALKKMQDLLLENGYTMRNPRTFAVEAKID